MEKKSLLLYYFQKKEFLTVKKRNYQETLSSLFQWLAKNDQAKNDLTSRLVPNFPCQAKIVAQEKGIAAGLEEMGFLLQKFTSLSFQPLIKDGLPLEKDQVIAHIRGPSREILSLERTILNFLQRMSGIATETNRLINLLLRQQAENNFPTPFLSATRKTFWGVLDKKAVAVGGGLTHRLSLADGILIKDNHLKAWQKKYQLKNTSAVIEKFLPLVFSKVCHHLIELEVTNSEEAKKAFFLFSKINPGSNVFALMFDNFSPSLLSSFLQDRLPSPIIFEASGGINKENLLSFAQTGVDLLSLGALTHSASVLNFSLEIL